MLGTVWSSKLYFTTNINLKVSLRSQIGVGYLGNIYKHYEKKKAVIKNSFYEWLAFNEWLAGWGRICIWQDDYTWEGPLEP